MWGWGKFESPLRDSNPCRNKGSPVCTISKYPYLVTYPENFLKVPWAPINTNFEGGARAEKARFFLSTFSQKVPKKPFLVCFFNFLLAAQKI